MDRVVSRQALYKRALEKQMDEIEVRQRQSETRRLKQIRDLGVDLSRIQKTSRDLETLGDLAPRRLYQRRGSLPILENAEAAPLFLEPPRTSRSGRRYSCIGSPAFLPPDVKEENSDDAFSETELAATDEPGSQLASITVKPQCGGEPGSQLASITVKSQCGDEPSSQLPSITVKPQCGDAAVLSTAARVNQDTPNKDIASFQTKLLKERPNNEDTAQFNSSSPRVRRGSSDITDNKGMNSNNHGHNVTTVFIHDDRESVSKETTPQDEETSEADSATMRRLMRNRGRRKSEPAVGGFFIRRLQATEFGDVLSHSQRNSADSEELKRSIQTNLPSNIVEEKEEEEREEDDSSSSTENAIALPESFQQKFHLSSISEHGPDGEQNTYSLNVSQSNAATAPKDRNLNQKSRKPEKNFPGFRGRRSSDGELLSYSHAKKLHEAKHQVWRLHESAYQSAGNRDNFGDSKK